MKSQLLNLVRMDLYASKRSLWIALLIPMIYPAFFRGENGMDAVSYLFCICMCGYMLFAGFAAMDEKFKTAIFLNTLPVKRDEIIASRYLAMYIVYAITTLIYVVAVTLLHLYKPASFGAFDFGVIPISLFVLSLVNAIQIPLYYVLDLQTSRIISLLLVLASVALLSQAFEAGWLSPLAQSLSHTSPALINGIFLILTVIVFTAACLITQAIYKRKEL